MAYSIIGFAGRMRSGKSTLSDICVKHGYKKIYFAEPLKKICADFLDISLTELDRLKNEQVSIDITLGKEAVDFFSTETDIPLDTVKNIIYDKFIHNVRELLQFIGTDLIRSFNMNWHLNQIKNTLKEDEKYVIDDVRFQNEKEFIENNGGDVWFIVKPDFDNVSHHPSEEGLIWQDFGDKVIINNKSLEYLTMTWDNFMMEYEKSNKLRKKIIVDKSLNDFDKNNDCDVPFSLLDSLFISNNFFNYRQINLDKNKIKSYKMVNKKLIINYNNEEQMIDNPLNIEDFKKIM